MGINGAIELSCEVRTEDRRWITDRMDTSEMHSHSPSGI